MRDLLKSGPLKDASKSSKDTAKPGAAAEESTEKALLKPALMELLDLRLERFGPHKNRLIRFQPGLNLVYGPNASGKSTVASALYFALTGHSLQPSARPTDYATDGTGVGTLTLGFRAAAMAGGNQNYQIVRSTSGELQLSIRDGARAGLLGATPQKSRLAIQKMLGIDAHRLGLAHFLREDEVGHFLVQTAGERKDLLRAALSLDQWERSLKIFREARRLARARHKEVSSALKQLTEPSEGPEAKISELRRTLEHAEAAQRVLLETEGGERLEEMGHARRRARELEEELGAVLFPLPSSAHLVDELARLESELDTLSTLDSDLGFARQHLGELLGLQQSVSSDLARLRSLLDTGEHHCPTCEQALDLSLIQSLIDQKRRTQEDLQAQSAASRSRLEALEVKERDRDENRRRSADLRVKREKVRTLTAELEGVLGWIESARSQVSGESARKLAEVQEKILASRAALEKLLMEQGAASERREQFQGLQERSVSSNKLKLRLEAAVDALEGSLTEVAEGWFTPMERRLQSLLQSIGVLASASVDVHSNPMRPRLVEGEGQRDFASLSGSERALLYLCFKGALSETLGIVPFLVLDEPTVHLDGERKRRLIRLLRQMAGTRKQVIVASNDPWFQENLPESNLISLVPQ